MNLELNYHNSVVVLPGAVIDKLDTASDVDLRLLILISTDSALREDFDAEKAAARLGIGAREVEMSLSFWRGAGLIKAHNLSKKRPAEVGAENTEGAAGEASGAEAAADARAAAASGEGAATATAPAAVPTATLYNIDALPDYSGKELEALMAERRELGQLLKECQKVLGKVFNVSESNKIIALTDYLHLPDDYILTLCSYCKLRGKGSVAYVVTTAKALFNEDVVTIGALENYIEEREKKQDFENFMRQLLGLGGAKLTASQKRFLDAWQASGLPNEVLSFAYETSVDSTGTLSMQHMNKVIETYKKAGVSTLEDAKKQNEAHREEMRRKFARDEKKPQGGDSDFKTFEVDEWFDLAKKKSMEAAGK